MTLKIHIEKDDSGVIALQRERFCDSTSKKKKFAFKIKTNLDEFKAGLPTFLRYKGFYQLLRSALCFL